MTANKIDRIAGKFEQTPDCGCAKRELFMNSVVPGSGTAVKMMASGVANGLHKAARLLDKTDNLAAKLPERKYRPSPWTVPPVPAEGWTVLDQCSEAMLFQNGSKYQVWTITDGKYSKSHMFTGGNLQDAQAEFAKRCHIQK